MKIKYVIVVNGTKKEVSKFEFYSIMRKLKTYERDFQVVDSWIYDKDAFLPTELRKVKTLTTVLVDFT